ncbi:MAG: SOS response-associated peptidase [Rhodococcus sp. (in: high G+C Gram-positive bacteria)]|uniref:SOS response-associated peptidase n=1 Tax=Rhodococcus sp. TaxID=1831 RepID=UPI003BAF1FC9
MCGRYATTANPATLAADLDAINETGTEDGPPDYNVAPTTGVLTVVDRHGARRIRRMRWGLVPPWTKELGKGPVLFNARADSVATKPAFRSAFARSRCLVPMDGWYEWQTETGFGTGKGAGKAHKVPYYMAPEDGSPLYMAGLWAVWHDPAVADSTPVLSCSVITVDSVARLEGVHDRMPLVMPRERWTAWLDPERPASADLLEVSLDAVADITVHRVSPLVNSVKNNGPELLVPVSAGRADAAVGEQISLL